MIRKKLTLYVLSAFLHAFIFAEGANNLEVSDITVAEYISPALGERSLLYYTPSDPKDRPRLVVRLTWPSVGRAVASVFDAPDDLTYVPITFQGNRVIVNKPGPPTLYLESFDGWWVKDGRANYNFDVEVRGTVQAIWSPGFEVNYGDPNWVPPVEAGLPSVNISVRDPKRTGIPKWDFRNIVPLFPLRGYYRANYAERKCPSPLTFDLGVSPQWPYVAEAGGYEQFTGELRPPIVVDWERGKITHFSELVTVRNQNCSYSFYSIDPIIPGQLNHPNFESPFAFYDLSGEGTGSPNLVLRTERHPTGDIWLVGPDPVDRDIEAIRYSWRNEVGDLQWDYKIEVLGFHPYTFKTPIAGGKISIDAPPYEHFPKWVVERPWPITVFIDAEESEYRSSEGIYEWSTRSIGDYYALGWVENENPTAFSELRVGLRGEYRYQQELPPELYLSPIDGRLHLLGAEGGVWDLGNEQQVRVKDVSGDLYLDHWTFEGPNAYTELANLGGYLLLADNTSIRLKRTEVPNKAFSLLPPTDKVSWQEGRESLAPYQKERRDPSTMRSWFEAFSGPELTLAGAKLEQLRIDERSFHLILALEGNRVTANGLDIPALRAMKDGRYQLSYTRSSSTWLLQPTTPPKVSFSLTPGVFQAFSPYQLRLRSTNIGGESLSEPAILYIGDLAVASWKTLAVPGNGAAENILAWVPHVVGQHKVNLVVGKRKFVLETLEVIQPTRISGLDTWRLLFGNRFLILSIILLGVFVIAVQGLWLSWWSQ